MKKSGILSNILKLNKEYERINLLKNKYELAITKSTGNTFRELIVLITILKNQKLKKPVTHKILKSQTKLKNVSYVAKKLKESRLIKVKQSDTDSRSKYFLITKKGLLVVKKFMKHYKEK